VKFQKIKELSAGDSFGELALISKQGTRTASIQALKDTYLGVISKDDYDKIFLRKH